MKQELEDKYHVFSTEPTDEEIEHINTLITDIRLRDIALMCAKLSAAEDGFHELESQVELLVQALDCIDSSIARYSAS